MSNGPELEARVTALETQMVQVAAGVAAARHLAAATLGVQTAARSRC